jgi:16S rRNA (guanine527-N7)-methyltransferase
LTRVASRLTPTAAITELAGRYRLPVAASQRLHDLAMLLIEDPAAPTAVREPRAVVDDHIADSLVALELAEVASANSLADIGAGAGLPGLALAIALPETEVVLVESSSRKCDFLRRAITACDVSNAHVVHERAEAWPAGLERFDLLTARALAPLDVVAEYAAPLLRVGGALVAWRGRRDPAAEAAGARAAVVLGLSVRDPIHVVPYQGAEHRHLHLMSKLSPTPDRFPRRPGIARKRPLGGDLRPAGSN